MKTRMETIDTLRRRNDAEENKDPDPSSRTLLLLLSHDKNFTLIRFFLTPTVKETLHDLSSTRNFLFKTLGRNLENLSGSSIQGSLIKVSYNYNKNNVLFKDPLESQFSFS